MPKQARWFPPLLLLLLFGCGGKQPDIKAKEYRGRFEDQASGIAFVCPGRWEVREEVHGNRVTCRSAKENESDTFRENLVIAGPIPGSSREDARNKAAAELKAQLENYRELPSSPQSLDYTHTQGGVDLRCHSEFLANKKAAGGFWIATLTSTAADYKRWEWDFNNIIASLGKPLPTPTPKTSATPTPKITNSPH